MAVNTTNPASQTTQQPQQPPAGNQQQFQGASATPYTQSRTSQSMPVLGLSNALYTNGSGGEFYEKLFAKFVAKVKALKDAGHDSTFNVLRMLKGTAGLHYSAIILAQTKGGVTAAHVLMVEKTGVYPDKLVENIAGVRYEIVRTPADALNDVYVEQARVTVSNVLKVAADTVTITDGTLVPSEFDIEQDTLTDELIVNTLYSTDVEIATRVYNFKGNNIAQTVQDNKNGKYQIAMYFSDEDAVFFDQTGMPVRQDICVALTFRKSGLQNERNLNVGEDTVEVVRTYGYIDFEYRGPQMINNNGMMMPSTQKFTPNFVITHMDSSQYAMTPDIVMLGVASVAALNEDSHWMQAFRPQPQRKNETDYRDIGALNIQGNLEASPTGFGKRYNTKDKTTTPMEFNKFIQNLVIPGMSVSMDLPKAGPETWFTSVFQFIKFRGDEGAYKRVTGYMSHATNGAFQPNNMAMFQELSNKVMGGFYKEKGSYRDVRCLMDYLAVANYVTDTNQTPSLITQYTNTLYNALIPAELRAATRRTYLDDMSKKSAVIKQHYDRVTFSSTMLTAWINALRSIGFAPQPTNMGQSNDMFAKPSTADFSSAILGQDVRITGAGSNLYGGFQAQGFYNRSF